jgi:hypothetical protein
MVAELSQLILKEGGFSAADTRYLDYCFGYHPVESKGRVDADVGWCIELVGDVERGIPILLRFRKRIHTLSELYQFAFFDPTGDGVPSYLIDSSEAYLVHRETTHFREGRSECEI